MHQFFSCLNFTIFSRGFAEKKKVNTDIKITTKIIALHLLAHSSPFQILKVSPYFRE